MRIVSFGGGTNSTAMLIGLRDRGIKPDLILFADPGGEMPETYEHIEEMQGWLLKNNFPPITTVSYFMKDGEPLTLEQECLKRKQLPPVAFGFKTCSQKYKIQTQEKFCNNHEPCKEAWAKGEKIIRYIGYDYGEPQRRDNAYKYDIVNKKFTNVYPMVDDWKWDREKCIEVIKAEGLSLPGKSSCFFCPNMKKHEVIKLSETHPDLYARAIAIEEGATDNLISVAGLGRNYAWKTLVDNYKNQINMCDLMDDEEKDMPCGCYD
jgi:hypothetical protein